MKFFITLFLSIFTVMTNAQQKATKQISRMANLQQLLKADTINNSIIQIDNFIGKVCDYGDHMERLSESQRLFYINQNLEREVNNGGFNQYFINSSGEYAHETVLALKAIGAVKTANILQQAIDRFPNSKVPKNRKSRITLVRKIDPEISIWDDVESKFMDYEEDLNALNLEFIEKHASEF